MYIIYIYIYAPKSTWHSQIRQFPPSLSHQQSCFSGKKNIAYWRQTTHLPRPLLVFHDHPLPWRWYDKLHILRANNAWRCVYHHPEPKKERKAMIVYGFVLGNCLMLTSRNTRNSGLGQWKLLHDLKRK